MARTTRAGVATIIELDDTVVPDDNSMLPFILTANELVTELCTGSNAPATEYTAERLELIERYLAAHFYTLRDPRPVSEGAGPVSVTYQSSVAVGLQTSHYGQIAMRLDTNGGLAGLDAKMRMGSAKPGVTWLGTAVG